MKGKPSNQTRNNWLLDASLFLSALIASLSGIYFLFAPSGGYQGGRNLAYGMTILFTRQGWDSIHTWSGVIMIAVALFHIALHWKWIANMTNKVWRELISKSSYMNARGRFNLAVNISIGLGFILSAVSGVYFLFAGGSQGGRVPDPMFIFTRGTWDAIHTWSSIFMIAAAIIHFAIHWRWVVKVTSRVLPFESRQASESFQA